MENESHKIAWLSGAETGVHPTQMTNGHNHEASADGSCEGDEVNDVGKLLQQPSLTIIMTLGRHQTIANYHNNSNNKLY